MPTQLYTILIHTWLHQSPKFLFGRILSFQSSNCFKPPVLKKRTAWVYFLSCFKPPVLKNRPLEFTFLSCFKPSVLNNGSLEFTFLSCFKPPVLNNGPFEFTFLSCFKSPVLNNGPLGFTFHHVSNGRFQPMNSLKSHFIFSKVLSIMCLVERCH